MLTRLLTLLAIALFPVAASAQIVEVDLPYTSAFTFRGAKVTGASYQPNATVTLGDAYVAVWANRPVDTSLDHEVDYTAAYACTLGGFDLDGGVTAYTYPNAKTTWEPFITASHAFKGGLEPSLTLYRDLTLRSTTAQAALTYTHEQGERLAITPRAALGMVRAGGESYTYWEAAVEASYRVARKVGLFGAVTYVSSDVRALERDITAFSAGLRLTF